MSDLTKLSNIIKSFTTILQTEGDCTVLMNQVEHGAFDTVQKIGMVKHCDLDIFFGKEFTQKNSFLKNQNVLLLFSE